MLSKKEKEKLYQQKAIVEKWQGLGGDRYNVHMSLTPSEMLALQKVLERGPLSLETLRQALNDHSPELELPKGEASDEEYWDD